MHEVSFTLVIKHQNETNNFIVIVISSVFMVTFEQISHIALVFPLLNLNK